MRPIVAVFYRDYRQRMTNIAFVFWDLVAPLAYLALFGLGFERMTGPLSIAGAEVAYTAFFLPGVLAMVTFMVALNTSWGFFMDKDSGIFDELLTYPITRTQLLVGKISFNVLLAIVASALVVLVGVLAFDVAVRWDLLPLSALVIVASTAGWFFVFSALAIGLRRMDAFNTVTSIAYIILMFISSMFYPLATTPAWFRGIAWANPLTWQVDLLRFSMLGMGDPRTAALAGGALLLFTAGCLALAVRTLERAS